MKALTSSRLSALLSSADNDKVLVLIQLVGGNDGLNTLVPLDQLAALNTVRPTVMLPESSLLATSQGSSRAFHPRMQGFQRLHGEGKLSIVQSVGYPNQNRSHFRSTDIWSTASPAEVEYTTGWAGRYLESLNPGFPEGYPNEAAPHPLAIAMGNAASETCQGTVTNVGQTVNNPLSITYLAPGGDTALPDNRLGKEIAFLRTAISQTNAYGAVINEAAEAGTSTASYPEGTFGDQLRNVARMIHGGLQTKVYVVQLGSFDTHSEQVANGGTAEGRHADLLGELSDGLAAFLEDMDAQGLSERVMGMTYSEFGRRIRSNNSRGTDHGDAAPLFVFGGCASGSILGENPEIDPEVGVGDAVPMQYDFRDVYGSIMLDWFGVSENEIRELILPDFQYLPVAASCNLAPATLAVAALSIACRGKRDYIELNWQLEAQTGGRGYEVERSTDGHTFTYVGWEPTADSSDYTFVDRDVTEGSLYYYRLRQVGHDGGEELSTTVTGRLRGSAIAELTVGLPFPNPVVDRTSVKIYAPTDGRVTYTVYDLNGRRLLRDSQALIGRRDNLVEVRTGRLPAGAYAIRFEVGGQQFSRRISVR